MVGRQSASGPVVYNACSANDLKSVEDSELFTAADSLEPLVVVYERGKVLENVDRYANQLNEGKKCATTSIVSVGTFPDVLVANYVIVLARPFPLLKRCGVRGRRR